MRISLRLLSSAVQKTPFYITTPIFYVNAAPHLGHLYTAVVADAIQRFEKLTNPDCQVIFSTGTDEHGTKIQQAAAKAKLSLPEYCSNVSDEYKQLFRDFNVDYTDFIRTTEERHKVAVRHFWNKLVQKDYVYKSKYSGWYSVNDEAFVPETHVKDEVRDGENVKVSIESGHKVEWTEETNYMFRLSAFKSHLQQWLKNDGVITPSKFQKQLQEMLASDAYLPDISVSRPSNRVHWAIRVPGDEEQSIYVWLDALVNYLTVVGYPDRAAMVDRGRPWPADVHVVGKDILKFHGIYWPAFLMAIKWHPPRRLLVHSHWTVDGAKMSKSLGNVVCPRATPVEYDALRYLLLREATMASDANGVVLLDEDYVRGRKVFGQLVCTFRYGREEDEVMGLNFYKELFLASEQIYPPPEKRNYELSRTQERLIKKLGEGAVPFRLTVPAGAPGSVTLQPGLEDEGEPCGVQYYVKVFVGDSEIDRSHRRSTVALGIRKVQYAPAKPGPQPCTVVRKDFVLSPGQLELELTLDKQLYIHGETVAINMCVRNHSNKVVKKIKACIQQGVDVVLFQNGQYRNIVASIETQDGCPLQPGSSLQKVLHLTPTLAHNRDKRGIALDGQLKRADTTLASTTLLLDPDQRDAFGIVVSYSAKVKLYLGAISGELVAELPFILMHPKEGRVKMIHADSQADVEMFRQDTVHHQESVEVY